MKKSPCHFLRGCALTTILICAVPGALQADLVGYWSLDGDTDADFGGWGASTVVSGANGENDISYPADVPAAIASRATRSLAFDTNNDDRVVPAFRVGTAGMNGLLVSVSFWMKRTAATPDETPYLYLGNDSGDPATELIAKRSNNRIHLAYSGNDGVTRGNQDLSADAWHHVVITYSRKDSTRFTQSFGGGVRNGSFARIYVDGADVTGTSVDANNQMSLAADAFLRLGGGGSGQDVSGIQFADVSIWDEELLLHQVRALANGYAPTSLPIRDLNHDGIDDSEQLVEYRTFEVKQWWDYGATVFFDRIEGTPEVDGITATVSLPPALSDVTLTIQPDMQSWADASDPSEYLLLYLNGTFYSRLMENPGEHTLVIPQATWETLLAATGNIVVTVELSAAIVPYDGDTPVVGSMSFSYTYDRDVNDNGGIDDGVPDGDPSGPDTDGDGVPDHIDRSPNTIADPSLVDAYGQLMRVARFDTDEDGDVDVNDLDALDAAARDVDGDGDIDLHDIASILHGARGPGVAADPAFLQELQLFKAHTFGPEDLDLKPWYEPLLIEYEWIYRGTYWEVDWEYTPEDQNFMTYMNANERCRLMYGTHLASIDKLETQGVSQLRQMQQLQELTAASGSKMSWIGLYWHRGEVSFVWENGQKFQTSEGSLSHWAFGGQIPGSGFFTLDQNDFFCAIHDTVSVNGGGDGTAQDYRWLNVDGITPSIGEQTVEGFVAQLPANTVPAAPVTTTETVTVTLDSSFDGQVVAPGQTVDWTISFEVSSGDNSGLALLVADLEQDAGNPATFDLPAGNAAPAAVANFAGPLGFTGPGGFGGQQTGTPGALNLAEIGGAQNTLGGASSDTTQGQGTTVVTGLGQSGSTVFATGSFTAPIVPGTYTLNLANTLASVLKTVGGAGEGSEIVPANITLAQDSISMLVSNPEFRDCDNDGIDDRDQLEEFRQMHNGPWNQSEMLQDSDQIEGTPEVDGITVAVPAPPALSDVTLTLQSSMEGWVSGADPAQYLLVYLNGTYFGRFMEHPGENSLVVPQATWETLRNGKDSIDITVEFSAAIDPDYPNYLPDGYMWVSYTLDRDVNNNGWLDDCLPDGDPSGPDTDGDGVSDDIDRSPNTIADPSLVDVYGQLLRVARFDADEDGDVDVSDFDLLDAAARDADGDGDIDLHDLASILHGARGPGVAADPAFLQELQLFKAHTFGPEDLDIKPWYRALEIDYTRWYSGPELSGGSDLDPAYPQYHSPYAAPKFFIYASELCWRLYGTHLASIDKLETQGVSQLRQMRQLKELTAASGSGMSWIGMMWRRAETSFVWQNGQHFDTFNGSLSSWEPGEQIPGSGFFTPGQDDYFVYIFDNGTSGRADDYYWFFGDGVTAARGEQEIEGFVAQLPANTVPAAPVTTTETVTVTLDSSLDGQTIAPGQTVDWTISFEVSTGDNSGLALLVADLEQDGGNPVAFDLPAGNAAPAAMTNFAGPLGFTGSGGFGGQQTGTPGALNLAQIGGAQNTLGGASSNPTQGQGTTVVAGLGQSGSTVFATGSFTAPATVGAYTFNLANTVASVLKTVGGAGEGSEIVPANLTLAQSSISFEVSNPPVITLLGNNPVTHEAATPYTDAGATASDVEDGDLTSSIVVVNAVNPNALGSYTVTYNVTDSAGATADEITRTVDVVDTTPPVITLLGANPVNLVAGDTYVEPGATALDGLDGDLSGSISVGGTVNTLVHGTNILTYDVTDSSGNVATTVTRTVFVDGDEPPTFAEATVPLTIDEGTTGVVYSAVADDPDGGVRFDHPNTVAMFLTDEGTGGVASDALGSDVKLSFNAARWTVDSSAPGGAHVLNTRPQILPGDRSWFTVDDFNVTDGLTVSEWLRFDNLQSSIYDPVIWKFGDMQVVDYNGSLLTVGATSISVASPFIDGEWAHLIFSIGTDGHCAFYLNGTEIANGQAVFDSTLTGNTFGRDWASDLDGINGARSDLTIIDGVLSPAQAQRLYQSALGGHRGDVLRYSLGSAGDEGFFTIDAFTGELTATTALYFETPLDTDGDNVYLVEVVATDDEGFSASQVVEVTINNTNIAPVITGTLVDPIPENTGYYVYDFTVADADTLPGDLIIYPDDSRFDISSDGSGGYRVHRKSGHNFNYENIPSYAFNLIVSDGVEMDTVPIAFTLVNLNDSKPAATFTSAGPVTENDSGAVVGTLAITDADGPTTFYFDIDPRFEVAADGVTVKLKDGVSLDYEVAASFETGIVVSDLPFDDADGNWTEVRLPITVVDVNDVAPSNLQLSANQVTENDPGATVGTLSADDADGPSLSFSVSDPRFEVDGTTLKLVDGLSLDREATPSVPITVTASDGTFDTPQAFTITVLNVDEGGPANLALSNTSIPENSTGVIGTLSATDIDGDTITFTESDSRVAISGTTLSLTTAINHESLADGTISVEITATAGGVSVTETFVITIEDVNEAPSLTMTFGTITDLTGTYTDLPTLENIRQATVFFPGDPLYPISFVSSDVDGDALTYVLGGADAAAFTVDPATGALNFVTPADFESPADANGDGTYEVTVTVSDGDLTSNTITLGLTIIDTVDEVDATVEGRWVFYNNSAFDGDGGASADDDNAIAPDKAALLPGGVAAFANCTSYSKGLNGIMVDIANLPGTPTASDFTFRTGNDQTPAGWTAAPDPVSITVRGGAGTGGSDRVTLIWNDNNLDATADVHEAVAKAWLEVTVLATANTGLAAPHTFYFGNAVGETGLANTLTHFTVTSTDAVYSLNNPQVSGAGLTEIGDHNRDQAVTAADASIAINNLAVGPTALIQLAP